jgi:hypothetical protein
LEAAVTTDAEIDEVFNRTDDMMWEGKFAAIDAELAQMDVAKVRTQMLVTWLCSCYRASDKLAEYKPFLERCTTELKQREPEWKRLVEGFDRPYRFPF